jgi:phosphoribosylformylglycinamidine synthase I
MNEVSSYSKKGGNVLGICNGFQILTESHLLQGALKRNDNLHFISKFHHLKVENSNNKFLSKCEKDEVLNIPIAHHDGNFFCDNDTLKSLYDNEQVLVKYCDKDGNIKNPNGSIDSIAGICNKEKNVFGLMPHPERAMEDMLGSSDGIKMLESFIC